MHSAWEANAARAAAIRKTIVQQGCSSAEFMNDTLRITELLFKGRLCLQILCPVSWHGGLLFNLIVLPGIIPWITGHSVSGMFALQVRTVMCASWFVLLGGFSIWKKPSSVYRERGNKNQSSSERLLRVLSWERRVGTGQEQGGPVQGGELALIP